MSLVKVIMSWSWSRYFTYTTCPKKAFFSIIRRIKEPENAAMANGKKVHTEIQDYVAGKRRTLPKSGEKFKSPLQELRKNKRHVGIEVDMAVTRQWQPCKPTDWDNCWLRAKIDLSHEANDGETLVVIDLKTGKYNPSLIEQLELYAACSQSYVSSHIKRVKTELWFLEHGEIITRVFTLAECVKLQKQWERKTRKMLADKTFKCKPTAKCRWCWYGQAMKSKGGPGVCEF